MKKIFITLMLLGAICVSAELDQSVLHNEDKLIALLKTVGTSENDMVTACQNLGWCGTAKAFDTLYALLSHEKAHIRHAARYGLEMIPDVKVADLFNRAAGELKGDALLGVVQSLGNRGNAASVKILAGRLSDADKRIAAASAQALGKLATDEALAKLKDSMGKCPFVSAACLEAADTVASRDPAKAAACYAAIRNTADNVTKAQRLAALRGEIVTAGDNGLQLWREAIQSSDSDTVDTALRAVLDYPTGAKATTAFAEMLKKAVAARIRLAGVLGTRGDKAAVPALAAIAGDTKSVDVTGRLAAASALAAMNDPAAVPALIALVKDQNQQIAANAKNALIGFAGVSADDAVLRMMNENSRQAKLSGIELALSRRMSERAVAVLTGLVVDTDAAVSGEAIKAIGSLGTDSEIPVLLKVIKKNPANEVAIKALSSLCERYARPRGGKTVIKSAIYGDFENSLIQDVTDNVQKLVDAGSITIQASGRLCRWDGFSRDPAPGRPKVLRMIYTFDGVEKSVQVRENDSVHLSGEVILPAAYNPVRSAYNKAEGAEKLALFQVLTSLSNEQGLEVARAAAKQGADKALQEAAIRVLINWKTPDALKDAAALAQNAPTERLRILALRGFVRQLEMSFTIPIVRQIEMLRDAQAWAPREQEKQFMASAVANMEKKYDESGFKSMFNGKNLSEWRGGDGWWSVKDGILQAQSFENKPCEHTCHLIWKGGKPGDFEMRCEFLLSPDANSGVQLRAANQVRGDSGYQADMNGSGKYVGYLYHPKQHLVGQRGAKVVINAKGEKSVKQFADSDQLQKKVFQAGTWNKYRIVCKGASIKLYVNDILTSEFEDHRPDTLRKGFITLQMHKGKPMKIQFRNLRIKML
jgi:HEAT repeat protein